MRLEINEDKKNITDDMPLFVLKDKSGNTILKMKDMQMSKRSIQSVMDKLSSISDLDFTFTVDGIDYSIKPLLSYLMALDTKLLDYRETASIGRIKQEYKKQIQNTNIEDIEKVYKVVCGIVEDTHKSLLKINLREETLMICNWFAYHNLLESTPSKNTKHETKRKPRSLYLDTVYYDTCLEIPKCADDLYAMFIYLMHKMEGEILKSAKTGIVDLHLVAYRTVSEYLHQKTGIDISNLVFESSMSEFIDEYYEDFNCFRIMESSLEDIENYSYFREEILVSVSTQLKKTFSTLLYFHSEENNKYITKIKEEKSKTIKQFKSSEKALNKQMATLKSEYKTKDKQVKYLTKKIAKIEKQNEVYKLKEELASLQDKVKDLESKVAQRDNRIKTLETRLQQDANKNKDTNSKEQVLKEVSLTDEVKQNKVSIEDKIELVKKYKYAVIGGNDNILKGLSNILTNAIFTKDSYNFSISDKVDYIIICGSWVSHSQRYKAETYKNSVKDIITIHNTNVDEIVNKLYRYLKDKES